jgi:hypothetical protein
MKGSGLTPLWRAFMWDVIVILFNNYIPFFLKNLFFFKYLWHILYTTNNQGAAHENRNNRQPRMQRQGTR